MSVANFLRFSSLSLYQTLLSGLLVCILAQSNVQASESEPVRLKKCDGSLKFDPTSHSTHFQISSKKCNWIQVYRSWMANDAFERFHAARKLGNPATYFEVVEPAISQQTLIYSKFIAESPETSVDGEPHYSLPFMLRETGELTVVLSSEDRSTLEVVRIP